MPGGEGGGDMLHFSVQLRTDDLDVCPRPGPLVLCSSVPGCGRFRSLIILFLIDQTHFLLSTPGTADICPPSKINCVDKALGKKQSSPSFLFSLQSMEVETQSVNVMMTRQKYVLMTFPLVIQSLWSCFIKLTPDTHTHTHVPPCPLAPPPA